MTYLSDLSQQLTNAQNDLTAILNTANDAKNALTNAQNDLTAYQAAQGSAVAFGRIDYDIPTVSTRYVWETMQGDKASSVAAQKSAGVKTVARYADPVVYRASDPNGYTQVVSPSTVLAQGSNLASNPWILKDSSGNPINRSSNGDYFLDLGLVAVQKAAATFLVNKCQTEGWDGITLDEINQHSSYSYSAVPAKYPTDAAYQQAELSFVTYIANTLHAAGKKVYINLGSDPIAWAKQIAVLTDGPIMEYFIGLQGTGLPAATIENGEWTNAVTNWAAWSESQAINPIFHATTSDAITAVYALASLLLVTTGKGFFCCAVQDYGDDLWTADFDNALKLGQPQGAYTVVGNVYVRNFTYGRVIVNPHSTAQTFENNSIAATTGLIQVS